jgi:hypothetical protein
MEVIRSSETSVHIRTTWRYIPEDGNIHRRSYKYSIQRSCLLLLSSLILNLKMVNFKRGLGFTCYSGLTVGTSVFVTHAYTFYDGGKFKMEQTPSLNEEVKRFQFSCS